jgi:hypothetical protein
MLYKLGVGMVGMGHGLADQNRSFGVGVDLSPWGILFSSVAASGSGRSQHRSNGTGRIALRGYMAMAFQVGGDLRQRGQCSPSKRSPNPAGRRQNRGV